MCSIVKYTLLGTENMKDYLWFMNEFKIISNLDLALYKEVQMQRRIESFIIKHLGILDYDEFIMKLNANIDLYDRFLEHITINVTEFYRNADIWNILSNKILTQLTARNIINIWSSGCSSGEEPYTIAMIIKDKFPEAKVNIIATDIDKKVLKQAKRGVYNISSMKSLPIEFRHKYFKKITDTPTQKNMYEISDEIKNMINFRQHNMLQDKFPVNLDLIICRNVVIYFKEKTKDDLYRRFHKSLNMNGFLFVGNTEQILNYRDIGFKPQDIFFFEKI